MHICNANQTNTPCVYLDAGRCMLRQKNCTNKHCTEPAPMAVPCPTPPPPPVGEACARLAACVGVSDEGCCVGCRSPLRTIIPRKCEGAIRAAATCEAVRAAREACGGLR